MLYQCILSLNSPICNLTDFIWVKFRPFLPIKSIEKAHNVNWMSEINEGISYITFVSKIYWEIEKVKNSLMMFINEVEHHFLMILVWNVLDHQSCSFIFVLQNFLNVKNKIFRVFRPLLSSSESWFHISSSLMFPVKFFVVSSWRAVLPFLFVRLWFILMWFLIFL